MEKGLQISTWLYVFQVQAATENGKVSDLKGWPKVLEGFCFQQMPLFNEARRARLGSSMDGSAQQQGLGLNSKLIS